MAYDNNEPRIESVYSKRIRAGKRRTYFFDVRATRNNDYFLTITESRKRFDDNGYDRHKIFLYKEDFNKFIKALGEAVDYVKTDLMPDFDFDAFNHDNYEEGAMPVVAEEIAENNEEPTAVTEISASFSELPVNHKEEVLINESTVNTEEVDKW